MGETKNVTREEGTRNRDWNERSKWRMSDGIIPGMEKTGNASVDTTSTIDTQNNNIKMRLQKVGKLEEDLELDETKAHLEVQLFREFEELRLALERYSVIENLKRSFQEELK